MLKRLRNGLNETQRSFDLDKRRRDVHCEFCNRHLNSGKDVIMVIKIERYFNEDFGGIHGVVCAFCYDLMLKAFKALKEKRMSSNKEL